MASKLEFSTPKAASRDPVQVGEIFVVFCSVVIEIDDRGRLHLGRGACVREYVVVGLLATHLVIDRLDRLLDCVV